MKLKSGHHVNQGVIVALTTILKWWFYTPCTTITTLTKLHSCWEQDINYTFIKEQTQQNILNNCEDHSWMLDQIVKNEKIHIKYNKELNFETRFK